MQITFTPAEMALMDTALQITSVSEPRAKTFPNDKIKAAGSAAAKIRNSATTIDGNTGWKEDVELELTSEEIVLIKAEIEGMQWAAAQATARNSLVEDKLAK